MKAKSMSVWLAALAMVAGIGVAAAATAATPDRAALMRANDNEWILPAKNEGQQEAAASGVGRLIATSVSFALCLLYLWLLPPNVMGMVVVLAVGTLVMVLLDRREDIITTAVTTIVVMVVALERPVDAWEQPLLRLLDTIVGIVIGMAGKWTASFAFYKARGEPVQ